MKKSIKNRDKFLKRIMDTFPFEESGDAGVYFDKGLNAEMRVAGNEISLKFRKEKKIIRSKLNPSCLTANASGNRSNT